MRGNYSSAVHAAVVAILGAAQAARAADATDAGAIEEVVVSATKRNTDLQETPVAITALNPTALENAHVQNIEDVARLVPSFSGTTQGDHGLITLTMRGIGNDSAKTEYADPEVAVFVNGIYSPRPEGATVLLFDMDAIEVLRGPQGTLWGRNSTVGAVNMQTAKARLNEYSGNAELGFGNYSRFGARGVLNIPLGSTFALRLSAVTEKHDGYVAYQQLVTPTLASQQAAALAAGIPASQFQPLNANLFISRGPQYNAQNQSAARVSWQWQPFDRLTWNASFEAFRDRGTPAMNLLQTPRPGTSFWSALIDTAPYLNRDIESLRSRVDFSITDSMNLAYVAGASWFNGSSDFDQDGGATVPTSFASGATHQEDRTNSSHYFNYSHELDLSSAGKQTVDWLLGLYYAAEDNSIRFDIPILAGTPQGTINWQGSFIQPKETVESKAVFGQATFNVTDALHLTGGARYTKDNRANVGGTNNGWNPTANPPTLWGYVPIAPTFNPLLPGSGFATFQHNDGRYESSKTTWLGRIAYDINKDFMAYASVSTGYKSGGLQDGGLPYGQETLTNYEIGTKNRLLGGKIIWNNAAYYEDFKDFQFSAPVTLVTGDHALATSNAEGAKVYGFESELAAKPTQYDTLQLSVAYLHTRLGHLIAGSNDYALPSPCKTQTGILVVGISNCLDVTDHELPHAPKIAAQLFLEHAFPLPNGGSLAPRASVHYESASWLSVFNLGSGDRQDAYTRADLAVRYTSGSEKPWSIDAFVQNVGDEKVKTNAQNSFGAWQAQYLAPRTYGANVRYQF